MSSSVNIRLRNISFVCTLLVIAIHVPFSSVVGSSGWWWGNVFANGITMVAVPFFFFASGIFAAKHFDENEYWSTAVTKRAKTLLVPFLCWSLLFCVEGFFIRCVHAQLHNEPISYALVLGKATIWQGIGMDPTEMPVLFPLWYVRSLFILFLMLPIFRFLSLNESRAIGAVIVLVGLFFLTSRIHGSWNGVLRHTVSIEGMLYFLLGCYCGQKGDLPNVPVLIGLLCGVVGIGWFLFRACLIKYGIAIDPFLSNLAVPFLMVGFWSLIPSTKWPEWLIGVSFGCYLIHPFFTGILGVLAVWVGRCLQVPIADSVWTSLVIWVLVSLLSIALVNALCYITPKLARMLLGGRVVNCERDAK